MTETEFNDDDPCLQKMSDILENCKTYSIKDLNTTMKPHLEQNFSMIFQNLDGNRTNFDSFNLQLGVRHLG